MVEVEGDGMLAGGMGTLGDSGISPLGQKDAQSLR